MRTVALVATEVMFAGMSFAYAGQCPSEQYGSAIGDITPTENYLVGTEVLDVIDLSKERVSIPNHNLRTRRLTVQPDFRADDRR